MGIIINAVNDPQSGGSDIISYDLEWNSGSGTIFTPLTTSPNLSLSFALSTGVNSGSSYLIRYRVQNLFGFSDYSDNLTIIAATAPSQIISAVTSNQTTNIFISWTPPSSNGSPIIAYRIKIRQSNGTMLENTIDCNGTNSNIISNSSCSIPMTSLINSPYSLTLGSIVIVTVEALNLVGYSPASVPNSSGGQIKTAPLAPTSPPINGSSTSKTQIQVDLTALTSTQTGNSDIMSYNIWYDNSSNGLNWVSLIDANQLTYTLNSVNKGAIYQFKYRAIIFSVMVLSQV